MTRAIKTNMPPANVHHGSATPHASHTQSGVSVGSRSVINAPSWADIFRNPREISRYGNANWKMPKNANITSWETVGKYPVPSMNGKKQISVIPTFQVVKRMEL